MKRNLALQGKRIRISMSIVPATDVAFKRVKTLGGDIHRVSEWGTAATLLQLGQYAAKLAKVAARMEQWIATWPRVLDEQPYHGPWANFDFELMEAYGYRHRHAGHLIRAFKAMGVEAVGPLGKTPINFTTFLLDMLHSETLAPITRLTQAYGLGRPVYVSEGYLDGGCRSYRGFESAGPVSWFLWFPPKQNLRSPRIQLSLYQTPPLNWSPEVVEMQLEICEGKAAFEKALETWASEHLAKAQRTMAQWARAVEVKFRHDAAQAGWPISPDQRIPDPAPIPCDTEYTVLCDKEYTILCELAEAKTLMGQVEIEAHTGISRKTVGNILRDLERRDMVRRPKGKNSGFVITPHGSEMLRIK